MGKYATRVTLRYYCAQAGITLYSHRLDGVSYQYCAGAIWDVASHGLI